MKKMLLAAFVLAGLSATAQTTLRIPLVGEEGTTVAAINAKLKAKGLKQLPPYFEVSAKKGNYKQYEQMAKAFADATEAIGAPEELATELIPNSNLKGTCYTGKAGQPVLDLVFSLAGSFYTEQMNLWGWKYKSQVSYGKEMGTDTDEVQEILKQSAIWTNWSEKDEAMLIVLAYSDDGDDINEVILPLCKSSK